MRGCGSWRAKISLGPLPPNNGWNSAPCSGTTGARVSPSSRQRRARSATRRLASGGHDSSASRSDPATSRACSISWCRPMFGRCCRRSRRRRSCCIAKATSSARSNRAVIWPSRSPALASSSSRARTTPGGRATRNLATTRSKSSSPVTGPYASPTGCSQRCCSQTSSVRPSGRVTSGTGSGARSSTNTTRWRVPSSNVIRAGW